MELVRWREAVSEGGVVFTWVFYLSTMVKPAVKRIYRRKAININNEREADQALRIPACGISVDLGISAHYAARSTRPEHPL